MSDKPFYDGGRADKNLNLIVRGIGFSILLIVLLEMFVFKNIGAKAFQIEYLYQAVHPFHWFFDSVGMIGMIFLFLYLLGLAGKTIYAFSEPKAPNSSGLIHVIAAISVGLMFLFFV